MNTKPKAKAVDAGVTAGVEKWQLLRAAKLCASVADAKSPILPYQSTLVRLSADGCNLSATSGAVSIRSEVGTVGIQVASFCVNAKRLAEVVAHMPDGGLQLTHREAPDGHLVIASGLGRASVKLGTTPAEDFPAQLDPGPSVQVDRSALITLLRRVVFCASPEEVTSSKSSVFLACDAGKLTAFAIDGRMLGVDAMTLDGPAVTTSLHANAATAFLGALEASEDPWCGLALGSGVADGDVISVSAAGTTISAKATGANHPPWPQLIPGGGQVSTVDRRELMDAVGRAALFATKDRANVDLFVDEDGLRLSCAGFAKDGSATTCIAIEGARKAKEVSVSWRLLRDALGGFDVDRVDLDIAKPLQPIVIRPAGVAAGQMYLIAPMNKI